MLSHLRASRRTSAGCQSAGARRLHVLAEQPVPATEASRPVGALSLDLPAFSGTSLSQHQRLFSYTPTKQLARSSHRSVTELAADIDRWAANQNTQAKPSVRHKMKAQQPVQDTTQPWLGS